MMSHRPSLVLLLPLLLPLAAAACGSDPPAARPVAQLSDAEAQTLCQQFFTAACASILAGTNDPACTSCAPCTQAASLATIRSECGGGITDAAVRHCVSSQFDMPTCTGPELGGCMFDVADALCPLPLSR
jgi:hypothetical protein